MATFELNGEIEVTVGEILIDGTDEDAMLSKLQSAIRNAIYGITTEHWCRRKDGSLGRFNIIVDTTSVECEKEEDKNVI